MTATLMTDYVEDVDSSFIEKVGLYVTSRDSNVGNVFIQMNNKVYRYDNVPFEAYNDLVEADSVGSEYHFFSGHYGPAAEVTEDAELEQIDDAFRITMKQPEEVVIDNQMTIDDVEDEPAEGGEPFDTMAWLEGLLGAPLEEQEAVLEGYTYSDEEIRADAVNAAARLLSRRKATAQDVIDVATTFEEFIKNGS